MRARTASRSWRAICGSREPTKRGRSSIASTRPDARQARLREPFRAFRCLSFQNGATAGAGCGVEAMGPNRRTRRVGAALALLLGTLVMAPATSAAEPDDRIAYARLLEGGGAEIFVANPDGSDEQLVPLEHLAEDFTVPVWSPDHEWLLISHMMRFDGSGDFLPWRPAIVRPDGSDYRLLEVPDGPQDMDCTAWSTDGSQDLLRVRRRRSGHLQPPVLGRWRHAAPDRSSVPAQRRGYARGRFARRLAAPLHPQEARAGARIRSHS